MTNRPASLTLAPGDPVRLQARAALFLGGVAAVAFVLLSFVSTQVASIRAQSPWREDPYDAVVSFTIFFVPALAVLGLVRVQLCRRGHPLPVARVRGVVRACSVISILVGITVLADWTAVLAGAEQSSWGPTTPWLIGALIGVTALAVGSAASARATQHHLATHPAPPDASNDWASDLYPLGELVADRVPLIGRPTLGLVQWLDRHALGGRWGVRRHPFLVALGASLGAGLLVAGALAIREVGLGWLFFIEAVVFASGTFAFLVLINRSLRLVHVRAPERAAASASWTATTSAALVIPVTVGFRDAIWSVLGLGRQVETPEQLAALLAAAFAVAWATAFIATFADHVRMRR